MDTLERARPPRQMRRCLLLITKCSVLARACDIGNGRARPCHGPQRAADCAYPCILRARTAMPRACRNDFPGSQPGHMSPAKRENKRGPAYLQSADGLAAEIRTRRKNRLPAAVRPGAGVRCGESFPSGGKLSPETVVADSRALPRQGLGRPNMKQSRRRFIPNSRRHEHPDS